MRSHPAQHGEDLWWSANLIAKRFRAPEGGFPLLPWGEKTEMRGGAFFNGKKRCQWVQWKLAFKLPSAARFIKKEGRGDFRRFLIDFIKVANNVVVVNDLPHPIHSQHSEELTCHCIHLHVLPANLLRLTHPSHQQFPPYRVLLQLLRILLPQSFNTIKAKPQQSLLRSKEI